MGFDSVTIKAIPLKVFDLAKLKAEGRLHLPDLQRGFVWTPDKTRSLFDSLYRRYPVGALLLWKPSLIQEDVPVLVRSWDICAPNNEGIGEPEPPSKLQDNSIYVLDGQQRLTSLFRVFFRNRVIDKPTAEPNLYVSLSPAEEYVDNPFQLKSKSLNSIMREGLFIRAEVLFGIVRGDRDESAAIKNAIKEWVTPDDDLFLKAIDRANVIRNTILNSEIISYEIDAQADDESVNEIFVRLNQQGVRLKPSDLAAARLTGRWKDFREQARIVLRNPTFKGFAPKEGEEDIARSGGYVDSDILVRTAMFLGTEKLRYREIEKMKNSGASAYGTIKDKWESAVSGLEHSVHLLATWNVPDASWVPYRYLLVPPAVAHACGAGLTNSFWKGWIACASLWGHYAGAAEAKAQSDAKEARNSDEAALWASLRKVARRTDSLIPNEDDVVGGVLQEGGFLFVLLLCLMDSDSRSLGKSKRLKMLAEGLEVHHIFPKAFLNRNRAVVTESAERLGNITIIYQSDNREFLDADPLVYLSGCDPQDVQSHAIPSDQSLWTAERYKDFCEAREKELAARFAKFLNGCGVS